MFFCVPKTRQQICQNNGRAIGQILMSECLAVDHLMVIRGWVRYCGILAVLSAGHKKHVFLLLAIIHAYFNLARFVF